MKTHISKLCTVHATPSDKYGRQAGHKALHTCTSCYAYVAMFSSSFIEIQHIHGVQPEKYISQPFGVFCQENGVSIEQYRLGAKSTNPLSSHLACGGTTQPNDSGGGLPLFWGGKASRRGGGGGGDGRAVSAHQKTKGAGKLKVQSSWSESNPDIRKKKTVGRCLNSVAN